MVGMLVHLDASTHEWIAGLPMQDLVVALDDADGRILYARGSAQTPSVPRRRQCNRYFQETTGRRRLEKEKKIS